MESKMKNKRASAVLFILFGVAVLIAILIALYKFGAGSKLYSRETNSSVTTFSEQKELTKTDNSDAIQQDLDSTQVDDISDSLDEVDSSLSQ